jgi:hypothetical protein
MDRDTAPWSGGRESEGLESVVHRAVQVSAIPVQVALVLAIPVQAILVQVIPVRVGRATAELSIPAS